MNIAGLDIATVSGLAVMKDRVITASTFRAGGKKKFLDRDDAVGSLDAAKEGQIGRSWEDHLRCWLIENNVGYVAIEAPIPSNPVRKKAHVNPGAGFAGQAITYTEESKSSISAIFRAYGLEMIALAVCTRLNIPVVFVHQGTWRKAFLGNGRPKDAKHEAKAMCTKLGIACSSLDAAEACGVVTWLDHTLNPYAKRAGNDLFAENAVG